MFKFIKVVSFLFFVSLYSRAAEVPVRDGQIADLSLDLATQALVNSANVWKKAEPQSTSFKDFADFEVSAQLRVSYAYPESHKYFIYIANPSFLGLTCQGYVSAAAQVSDLLCLFIVGD